ncbi:MAG: putative endonuclease distantly related to archaeal Holliday junction resolvase [Parcubacteria group bacterium Gr01-1014_48]|nr:MAG: putative endonuclease distantly related to archaeal Holliday junction resolvase [Parcubacteria group bacterium Greene0416_14]TSC73684.1 MAG: putative endonuclease distantly related to archaeal Holliday junction resolvase [Parcubacteria group bacterium Gr01-1014_48]TSD00264.1 MAG: putative endonuclease distantly related to archaeal Holliday junction resolvase [Parcubacteria group bacterium Greene1014_15]TSD07496.1 MAG: putative endonuclease distantly related to archaeal Holliday junction 
MYQRHLIGKLGEDVSIKFLMKRGFAVVARNYRKKYGEIDVIAKKTGKLHFIEVKTVSCEMVSREGKTIINNSKQLFRVEENVHQKKLHSLFLTIQAYLAEQFVDKEQEWQLDVHVVYLDVRKKTAKVDVLENVAY